MKICFLPDTVAGLLLRAVVLLGSLDCRITELFVPPLCYLRVAPILKYCNRSFTPVSFFFCPHPAVVFFSSPPQACCQLGNSVNKTPSPSPLGSTPHSVLNFQRTKRRVDVQSLCMLVEDVIICDSLTNVLDCMRVWKRICKVWSGNMSVCNEVSFSCGVEECLVGILTLDFPAAQHGEEH